MERTLRLFTDEAHDIPLGAQFRNSIAVLGMSRMGKSNTVARIFEQLMGFGVPGVIVDIANEYWGLKQQFGVIVVGSAGPHTDIIITDPAQAAALAVWSLRERMPIILNLRNYKPDMRSEVLLAYLEALWEEEGKLRRPYKIFLEEARNWAPQTGKVPTSDILETIAAEGLKDGLSLVVIGQRPASINKNLLTQCGIVILHRLWMANDLNVFNDTFGRTKWLRQKVVELKPGNAMIASDAGVAEVHVLLRETYHAGYTPGVDEIEVDQAPVLREISQDVLDSLRDMLNQPRKMPGVDRAVQLLKENEQLRHQLAEMEDAVQLLREEIERLSKLQVIMPETLSIDTINVHSLPLASAAPPPAVVAELLEITAPPANAVFEQRAVNRMNERFEKLLSEVKRAIPMHRHILVYLVQNETLYFGREQLARQLGYSVATLKGRQFTGLIELGLIRRHMDGPYVNFTAGHLRTYLAEQYPALNVDDMINRLLAACAN